MPRRARRDLKSCYLHVIVQGIEKKYIFDKEYYKETYRKLMVCKSQTFNVKILAYCIMGNHTHILLFSNNIEAVGKYMKSINTSYAHFYNKNENRVGYVFRDRFLSEAIQSKRQLYNCLTYIHHNPVKAKIVAFPGQYKYSSYTEYQNKTGIVNGETLKLMFDSRHQYMEMFNFLHFGLGESLEPVEEKRIHTKIDFDELAKLETIEQKCRKLKENNFSNRKIAEILNINRNKVNQIIKGMDKCLRSL